MSLRVTKAVIPVAGLGTRFLPATKSIPKEMLPIVDKPVVQFLVEEAVASGIRHIIFVISADKEAIRYHFSHNHALENRLLRAKKKEFYDTVRNISRLARFSFAYQHEPLGDAHAIRCAKKFVGDEPFAVLFGDDVVDAKIPALRQLLNVFQKYHAPVIALERVPWDIVSRYGVVKARRVARRVFAINSVIEKPTRDAAPSNLTIVGKYVFPAKTMRRLDALRRRGPPKEIRLTDMFLDILASDAPLFGCEFRGRRFDCGDKLSFAKAQVYFAQKHPDIKKEFRKYLETL